LTNPPESSKIAILPRTGTGASTERVLPRRCNHGGVRKFVQKYASSLVEGLVFALAFAAVDGLRGNVLTAVSSGAAGVAVGALLGLMLAEHGKKKDKQV
jgi:hypothetical protein